MSKKSVLVAFDSKTMRSLISSFLNKNGFNTIEAKDGLEALNIIYSEHPDCVLLYIDLPIINGYNMSRIVKNTRSMQDITVIICATEENSVYQFWADNSLSNGLFVPTENNLQELCTLINRSLVVNNAIHQNKKKKAEHLENPTQDKILQMAINAYDKELFNLYIIQSAYNGAIKTFNLDELMNALIKSLAGVYSYDALCVIINTNPVTEYYSYIPSLTNTEIEDFKQVCHTDFKEKLSSSNKMNWQKSLVKILNAPISNNSGKIKSYESFPTLHEKSTPMTIHVANCMPDSFNPRTKERLDYLASIYGVLVLRAIEFNAAKAAETKMKQAFSHFLPPKVINDIINGSNSMTTTVGEKREVAVLIADIRNFTTISEINRAEDVVAFLNQYFAIMGSIIKKYGGTIDKFMGDAIMALFGAPESYPDNGNRAANAALEMRKALNTLDIHLVMPPNYTLDIGTGIHYGATIVGSIGSDEKKEYTVIGDNVNIASRIESLTKIYGTPIIITDSVKKDLKEGQYTRHLDNVKVKGKSVSVAIYELQDAGTKVNEEFISNYNKGMNQYLTGNFELASEYFDKASIQNPNDKASVLLRERCREYTKHRPENWDGSFTLTTK